MACGCQGDQCQMDVDGVFRPIKKKKKIPEDEQMPAT
jgi:hypothetical protein